jgi:hypothetical protein
MLVEDFANLILGHKFMISGCGKLRTRGYRKPQYLEVNSL